MKGRLIVYVLLVLQVIWVVNAQSDDCPVEIDLALETANQICLGTGRNQVCYGNNNVDAVPYDDIRLDFESPGDMASLEEIRTLSLSAMDTDGRWGIALMRMLANLNPSEAEDLTVLLYGDVEIEDASGKSTTQIVTSNTYSNLRRYPNTNSAIMDSVAVDDVIHVTGRLEDNSWLRILNPETNITGWMMANFVRGVDLDVLTIVGANAPYFAPMQAFYFESGNGTLNCSSVPRDGIIIQTPEGLRRVTLWVNEVTIDFIAGTTTAFQTEEDGSMSVSVLEGSVYVSSETDGYMAVAGSFVNVKMSEDNTSVVVSRPVAIDPDELESIPTDNLGRSIELPEPATDEDIAMSNEVVGEASSDVVNDENKTDATTQIDSNTNPESNNNSGNSNNADDCPGNSCNAPGKNKDKSNNGKGNKKNN